MDKRLRFGPVLTTVFLVLAIPFSAYVGSFYALVDVAAVHYGPQFIFWEHSYSVEGEFIKRFYWPMEQIDKRTRPDGEDNHRFPRD
jgi:hypothetical protein